jgi:general L-amino acid transport system permease protein
MSIITTVDQPPALATDPLARARRWARRHLFRTWVDAILTVVLGGAAVYVTFRLVRYALVTGRWEIVRVNLKLLLVGRFPDDELWKVVAAVAALALWGGIVAGLVNVRQRRTGAVAAAPVRIDRRATELVARFWPLLLGIAVLLGLSRSTGPWITVLVVAAAAVVGRVVGALLGRAMLLVHWAVKFVLVLLLAAVPVVLVLILATILGWDEWGGFMINVFIAAAAIVLCFPLGLLLALGRRSRLPLLRVMCTVYIEIFRGSPLFVLLLLANNALDFFVPDWLSPGVVVRAIIVFTLFTAAYIAEIIRGGLQSVPPSQEEAAKALGLGPVRTTSLIVLPQALRNVIPAQIGQFISLFKDVSLAGAAMGVFDLLDVSTSITKQTGFAGQRLAVETLAFAAFLFWIGSYTMSRESQRLEKRLGVGIR